MASAASKNAGIGRCGPSFVRILREAVHGCVEVRLAFLRAVIKDDWVHGRRDAGWSGWSVRAERASAHPWYVFLQRVPWRDAIPALHLHTALQGLGSASWRVSVVPMQPRQHLRDPQANLPLTRAASWQPTASIVHQTHSLWMCRQISRWSLHSERAWSCNRAPATFRHAPAPTTGPHHLGWDLAHRSSPSNALEQRQTSSEFMAEPTPPRAPILSSAAARRD